MMAKRCRSHSPRNRCLPALVLLLGLFLAGSGGRAAAVPSGSSGSCPDSSFSPKAQAVLAALSQLPSSVDSAWGKSCNNTSVTLLQAPDSLWGIAASSLPLQLTCDPNTEAQCEPNFKLFDCTDAVPAGCNCASVQSTDPDRGGQQKVKSLCIGHSDSLYDEVYLLVRSAKKQVDITTLDRVDEQFLPALANAITYLNGTASKNSGIQVRFLIGFTEATPQSFVDQLTRGLPADPGKWNIRVSAARYNALSPYHGFNHSKIIAVDGKKSIVGGINLWWGDYLFTNPVHDLWLEVDGDAAVTAHEYASDLWAGACGDPREVYGRGPGGDACHANNWSAGGGPTKGSIRVIGAGRSPAQHWTEASTVALYAMIDQAERSVLISQQSLRNPIVPGLAWYDDTLHKYLYEAMTRGAGVDVVVSDENPVPGNYGAGVTPGQLFADLWGSMELWALFTPPPAAYSSFGELLCSKLRVAPLRRTTAPSGPFPANHAKFMMIDNELFYVGSQNLYPAGLAEFGYIVDDPATALDVKLDYWDQLWRYSQTGVARSGSLNERDVLCVPFNLGRVNTATQRSFSGSVTIKVSGTGHIAGTQFNDAFYIYADGNGNPYNPPVRWDSMLMINNRKAIDGTSPSYPAYNPSHVYIFPYNAPGGPLNFANADIQTGDNSGTYAIEVMPPGLPPV